jgi:hypothetical protein
MGGHGANLAKLASRARLTLVEKLALQRWGELPHRSLRHGEFLSSQVARTNPGLQLVLPQSQ